MKINQPRKPRVSKMTATVSMTSPQGFIILNKRISHACLPVCIVSQPTTNLQVTQNLTTQQIGRKYCYRKGCATIVAELHIGSPIVAAKLLARFAPRNITRQFVKLNKSLRAF